MQDTCDDVDIIAGDLIERLAQVAQYTTRRAQIEKQYAQELAKLATGTNITHDQLCV